MTSLAREQEMGTLESTRVCPKERVNGRVTSPGVTPETHERRVRNPGVPEGNPRNWRKRNRSKQSWYERSGMYLNAMTCDDADSQGERHIRK